MNRHQDGDWATVAVALHPGGVVRSAALDGAVAESSTFSVHAGTGPGARLAASIDRLQIDLDDIHLDLHFADPFTWPKAFGGGGVFSSIPFLNQYWHPYRLGGKASGTVELGGNTWSFDGALLYAERNSGRGVSRALVVGSGTRFRRCRRLGRVLGWPTSARLDAPGCHGSRSANR